MDNERASIKPRGERDPQPPEFGDGVAIVEPARCTPRVASLIRNHAGDVQHEGRFTA